VGLGGGLVDAQNEHGDVGRISSPISVANLGHMVVVDSLAVIAHGVGGDLLILLLF